MGTLGLGGQGVYALDVTDPESPSFLWEFTDRNDSRLGYTYGRPNVYRLSDGTWVAFVPAGYNSESEVDFATKGLPNPGADTHFDNTAGARSRGVVFAINIQTGASRAIPISGSRGLATIQLADYELDYKLDFMVVGDLNGDVYRVDVADLGWGDLGSAQVDMLFDGGETRPITAGASIFPDPATGKMVVVIGTGKYVEDGDREAEIQRQAIYGIRECGKAGSTCSYPVRPTDLVEQVVSLNSAGTYFTMNQTNVIPDDKRGWLIQLGNPVSSQLVGERVIDMTVPVSFSAGIVAVPSYIPAHEACSPAGSGAVYVLSALTGGFVFPGPGGGAPTDPIIQLPTPEPPCPTCVGVLKPANG